MTKPGHTARDEASPAPPSGRVERFLLWVERVGNRLPDTAVLFVIALFVVWAVSALLSGYEFTVPAAGEPRRLTVQNQLTGSALAVFLSTIVPTFTGFAPLGVVLVAMLGVGVAEHVGFIGAALRAVLAVTPRRLLTPMLLLVAVMSHTAADAGYVLVIPLGGVIFRAAGRHPLAGIACAFAGVSGGFAANFIPSGIDPLLQGFTQQAAQLLDPARVVNPLCNWGFTSASSILIILLGWFITDRIVEPRLRGVAVEDGAGPEVKLARLEPRERRGLLAGTLAMAAGIALIVLAALPPDSPLRNPAGLLTAFDAPLMQSIVPLIFLLFLIPAALYGYIAGTVSTHRDLIAGMAKTMSSMGYYLAMIFFCAQFTAAFGRSNIGALLSVEGADLLQRLGLPGSGHHRRHHPARDPGRPGDRLGVGEVGGAGTHLRAHPHAGRPVAGADPGRVSRRRLGSEHHHAADAVLPTGGGVLPALGEEHGDRHPGLADAALLRHLRRVLDSVPARLLGARPPARDRGSIQLSLARQ